MNKININLATRSYTGKRLAIAFPTAALILSAVIFLYLRGQNEDYTTSAERLEKRMSDISGRRPMALETPKELMISNADLAAVGDIMEKRRFSWIRVLDNLEKAIPSGISLSSIQPSFKEGGVKLSGYAKDFGALSKFIDNLERLKVYNRVFLVNQSLTEMDNKKTAFTFNINIEGGK